MFKIKKQIKGIYIRILNNIQKYFLLDDVISVFLRMLILKLMGIKYGKNTKILSDCDILGSRLVLGNNVFINRGCYFDLSGKVQIDDNISIGHGVTFITAFHAIGPSHNRSGSLTKGSITSKDIHIKKGVWVGANASIMPGITIEEGSIIATGSVITKNVADNIIVAGIPATIIKTL